MTALNLDAIGALQQELNRHPLYASLRSREDLAVFMSHHVFSVWDFMSLIKHLQRTIAPTRVPWVPGDHAGPRFFINQLVLEEESDCLEMPEGPLYTSHFEFYCRAMNEIGADGGMPLRFLDLLREQGLQEALDSDLVPGPSRDFTRTTFGFIQDDKPHLAAAALALGRERVIPDMFRRLLAGLGIGKDSAPAFHQYLERHIHLDEDFHGPLSLELLEALCEGDPVKLQEAETAAVEAINARLRFWDGVLQAIEQRRRD